MIHKHSKFSYQTEKSSTYHSPFTTKGLSILHILDFTFDPFIHICHSSNFIYMCLQSILSTDWSFYPGTCISWLLFPWFWLNWFPCWILSSDPVSSCFLRATTWRRSIQGTPVAAKLPLVNLGLWVQRCRQIFPKENISIDGKNRVLYLYGRATL